MNIRTVKEGDYLYLADTQSDLAHFPLSAFFDQHSPLLKNAERKGGRGEALIFKTGSKKVVMRHYRRGGLAGHLLKDRFFLIEPHAHRAFDEFRLLRYMVKEGLPVPAPLIAREKKCGCALIQDILIEALDAEDLAHILRKRALSQIEMLRLGGMIKAFFEHGIEHTDLNIRNILLDDHGNFYLIDFDKCFLSYPDMQRRSEIVSRLHRSFLKEKNKYADAIHYKDEDFALIQGRALS